MKHGRDARRTTRSIRIATDSGGPPSTPAHFSTSDTAERGDALPAPVLVALLGHELRTPLTSILGFVDLLERRADELPGDHRRMLIVIRRNARRMLLLLNDVLDLAQARTGTLRHHPADVELAAAIAGVLDDLGATLPDVVVDVPAAIVHVDPRHLEQMLANLLTNAARHGEPPVRITASSAGTGVVDIEVRDHGPGVSPALVDHLWEWFSRSEAPEADPASVGVGLAIVHLLAETNGGSIRYSPGTPTGAIFTLRLPGEAGPRVSIDEPVAEPLASVAPQPAPVVRVPDDKAAKRIVARATRRVLHASSADEIVGIVLAATHRLGGWTMPARVADDRALPLDLTFGRSEAVLPAAEGHSVALRHLVRHLPALVDHARRALDLLGAEHADALPVDPTTGLLNTVGIGRVLARIDTPAIALRLELEASERGDDTARDPTRIPPEAVAAFARHLQRELRITDHPGQLGNEQFVAVLPGATEAQVEQILDRLMDRWASVSPAVVDVRLSALALSDLPRDPNEMLDRLADAEPRRSRAG